MTTSIATRRAAADRFPAPAPAVTDALTRLRSETRPEHEAIELVPLLAALLAETTPLECYGAALHAMYGFYAPLEARLLPRLPVSLLQLVTPKKTLLARDLMALGLRPPASRASAGDLPALESEAAALGVVYVLEGATLGGKVIRRRLLSRHGDAVADALAFYGCYGDDCARHWQRVRTILAERLDADPSATDVAVEAARATFGAMSRWVAACPSPTA